MTSILDTLITERDRMLAALTELVRLKDLTERIDNPALAEPEEDVQRMALEVNAKEEAAWLAARQALKGLL